MIFLKRLFQIFIGTLFLILYSANFAWSQNEVVEADTTLITVLPDSTYDGSMYATPQWQPYALFKQRTITGLNEIPNRQDLVTVVRDEEGNYILTRTINGQQVGAKLTLSFSDFAQMVREKDKSLTWQTLAKRANSKRDTEKGLIDFKFNIPGGKESVFTTIFGKPEVNLRVTGTANMNIGASIQRSEDPSIPENQRQRVDPTFQQNLKLNIQGSIGDKLTINTDWDTERPFDYQNRLKIVYSGYDDEIIKTIELGNVTMETGNSLISGGQALFGIRSVAQLGSLKLTSVLSQKEGQGNSKTIDGGSTEDKIKLNPTDYENDRHFFMDPYARFFYEEALQNPIQRIQLFNFTRLQVYRLNIRQESVPDQQPGVAIVELGTRPTILGFENPDEQTDQLNDNLLNEVRRSGIDTLDVAQLAQELGVEEANIQKGFWVELQQGIDYTYDNVLGTLSLSSPIQPREALAVAFQYTLNGQVFSVGDFENIGEGTKLFKMIRQPNLNNELDTWELTMRNVYSLGPSNISSDGFELKIFYTGENAPTENLPAIQTPLIQSLGLDRVDQNGTPTPDNFIDFSTGVLDGVNGKLVFPYVEPFGQRIVDIVEASNLPNKEEVIDNLSFPQLYVLQQEVARQEPKRNFYSIEGSAKGGVSDTYNLGFGLVEGSVKVLANGVELTEGIDYDVDYSIGNVYITNKRYLSKGQEITIDYESNQIVQIQQTTFTGVRAEYEFSPDIKFGATYFRLTDQPLTDKIRLGDEPINNAILGFDAQARFDAPWLTRAIDKIPLLQTKEMSNVSFSGEFAQLRPGVAQTQAIEDAIQNNRLEPDEVNGVSFIDDFEGSKTSFNFTSPSRWFLSAAPASLPGYDPDLVNPVTTITSKLDRSDLRSQFSWYALPINAGNILGIDRNRATRLIQIEDVFDRETLQQENFLTPLDVFYNPRARGQYNYNMNLRTLLEEEPERTWGGMTTVLPQGLENLTLSNIEFIEFWVQPIIPDSILPFGTLADAQTLRDYDGKIYIDLGVVSEDIIPNFNSNNEDGLIQAGEENLKIDQNQRSYVLNRPVDFDGQFAINSLEDEDIGLDGLPSTNDPDNPRSEQVLFANFVESVEQQYGTNSEMYQSVLQDPSNDDYFYFAESQLNDKTMQERFLRMFGYPEANSRTSGEKRAVTNRPDAEGLIIPNVPSFRDSYVQYEIDWNPADESTFQKGSNFISDITDDRRDPGRWYQVRIPIEDFKRQIGGIQDFQSVSHIRIWMSGYRKPFTMRFATFELVGSQWRKAENVGNFANPGTGFFVSTINIEENQGRRPIPYRTPTGAVRAINRTQQGNLLANEQSLSLAVSDLRQGDIRMIRRNYPGGMNLITYSNLRMFVHGEGYRNRNDLYVVVRMGRDLERDYYEYRQPVTPSDTALIGQLLSNSTGESDQLINRQLEEAVWLPEENSVNIVLSSLNAIKQLRNLQGADLGTLFLDSTLVVDAPSGTVIGIKGNPSLQSITEIGIGVMNPLQLDEQSPLQRNQSIGTPSLDAEVWVNELRISGFDNTKGWAAKASGNVKFADFATVSSNYQQRTYGFGSLDSRLGNRLLSDQTQFNIASTINLHKLIPDRFGWNFPVGLNYSNNLTTPRFLPREGDIRLSDFEDAVRAQDIPEAAKDSIVNAKIEESQTESENFSFTLSNISKQRSQSAWLKNTLDNTTLNYSYSEKNSRSIQDAYNRGWNYSTGIRYSLSLRKIDLLTPFAFLKPVPVLNILSGLQLGYLPTNISASANLTRDYNEQLRRATESTVFDPLQTHNFRYNTNFGLSYNLTPTIPITFNSTSGWILNDAGQTLSLTDTTQFEVKPSIQTIQDIVSVDSVSARRDTYQENYGASWRPRFNNIKFLDWVTYSNSYKGGFSWKNEPLGSNVGKQVRNNLSINQNLSFKIQSIFKKIPLYNNLKEQQEKEVREAAKKKADAERLRRRNERLKKAGRAIPEPSEKDKKEEEKVTLPERAIRLGRDVFLSVLSLQSIDMSYNHTAGSSQNGYPGNPDLFSMFNTAEPGAENFSPNLGYRLGIQDQLTDFIGSENLNERVNLSVNRQLGNNVTVSTNFSPFKNFSIDLNWQIGWNGNRTRTGNIEPGSDELTNAVFQEGGDVSTTVWAFGGGYENLFRNQLQRGLDDYVEGSNQINDENGNQDGTTILARETIHQDFRNAFLGYTGSGFGKEGYLPLPMPSWKVTWSGIEEKIPFIGQYMNRATLSHGYRSNYRLSWALNPDFGAERTGTLGGQFSVLTFVPEFQASSINLERRFIPLVGLNITWKNNLSTRLDYEKSSVVSLGIAGPTLTDRTSEGVTFSTSYTKRGFRLPFFKRLKNTVDMTFSFSYLDDSERTFNLLNDLTITFQNGINSRSAADYPVTINAEATDRGQTRVQASTVIGYQFSRMIKANMEYAYSHLIPKSTRSFEQTTHDIRFNVIVSIRSN